MLTRPALADETISDQLALHYGLAVGAVTFLPLGADVNTAVFRVTTVAGQSYFLKLRRGAFDDLAVLVPLLLHGQGARLVMVPLADRAGRYWARAHGFAWVLYPFVEGRDGYEAALTRAQWVSLGATMASIHRAVAPPELAARLPREGYAPTLRAAVMAYDALVPKTTYADPGAAGLASLWRQRRATIRQIVARADELAALLSERALPMVICHGDLHPGNLLVGADDALAVVDWDTPLLAPKERDLLFVGGGRGGTWNTPAQDALFYQGYGQAEVDPYALSYFHYERIVADIAAYADELLGTAGSPEDRARSLGFLRAQFEPGGVIELAQRHDPARGV